MRADIELNAVQLNLNLTTNAKAASDKVAAQIQEGDSWRRLDFKLITGRFDKGEPLYGYEESKGEIEEVQPRVLCRCADNVLLCL